MVSLLLDFTPTESASLRLMQQKDNEFDQYYY